MKSGRIHQNKMAVGKWELTPYCCRHKALQADGRRECKVLGILSVGAPRRVANTGRFTVPGIQRVVWLISVCHPSVCFSGPWWKSD